MPRQHGVSSRELQTNVYIVICCLLAVGMYAMSAASYGGIHRWQEFLVFTVIGVVTWWLPTPTIDGRARFGIGNVILLSSIVLIGPTGAGLVAAVMAGLERRRIPLRRRAFNMAMSSIVTMLGSFAYIAAGGWIYPVNVSGFGEVIMRVGLPMLVGDALHIFVNALMVATVIRLSSGIPLKLQLKEIIGSYGPMIFAYGIIAFIIVLLWLPAGLYEVSILLVLAPLMGGRWALQLYGQERQARERALNALVAAIETRDPSLTGHGDRVSELAVSLAQRLGLGPQEVADLRRAGLLHDIGFVVVAPGRGDLGPDQAAERSSAMLQDLPFLAGASAIMAEAGRLDGHDGTLLAEVVRVAHEADRAIEERQDATPGELVELLRLGHRGPNHDRVLEALQRVLDEDGVPARRVGSSR